MLSEALGAGDGDDSDDEDDEGLNGAGAAGTEEEEKQLQNMIFNLMVIYLVLIYFMKWWLMICTHSSVISNNFIFILDGEPRRI